MSLIRDHITPTMHNAVGGIITAIVLASSGLLLALVKPIRDAVLAGFAVLIPVWLASAVLLIVAIPLLIHRNRLRARLTEANDQLKQLKTKFAEQSAAQESQLAKQSAVHESQLLQLRRDCEAQLQTRSAEQEARTSANLQHVVDRQREGTRFTPRRL